MQRTWSIAAALLACGPALVTPALPCQGPVRDWSSLEPLDAPGGVREGSRFGQALAWDPSGQRCWIAAPRAAAPAWRSGLVLEFRRTPSGFALQGYLRDPGGEPDSQLGWSLARGDQHLLAGAPLASGAAPQSGIVHAFPLAGGAPQRIASPRGQTSDGFGTALLAVPGGVWVGAPFARSATGAFQAGRVERYAAPSAAGEPWRLDGAQQPPFPLAHARFGEALALHADRLLVAAPFEPGGGAVYDFGASLERISPGSQPGAEYGASLARAGGWLAVGAPGAHGGAGAVFVYRRSAGRWNPAGELRGAVAGARLGAALAFGNGRLWAGAPNTDGGRLYGFREQGGTWTLEVEARRSGTHAFGAALSPAPSGGLLVGAPATLVVGAAPTGVDASALPSAWWGMEPVPAPARSRAEAPPPGAKEPGSVPPE